MLILGVKNERKKAGVGGAIHKTLPEIQKGNDVHISTLFIEN
jgi:hypothetical protein